MNTDDLFKEILNRTSNGEIKWSLIKKGSYSDVIFQSGTVFRCFESKTNINKMDITILFVEKKMDDPEWDFAFEKHYKELLILNENEIVYQFTDEEIDKSDFVKLLNLIEKNNDKLKKLLGNGEN